MRLSEAESDSLTHTHTHTQVAAQLSSAAAAAGVFGSVTMQHLQCKLSLLIASFPLDNNTHSLTLHQAQPPPQLLYLLHHSAILPRSLF